MFMARVKGAERDPLGKDLGTNRSENPSSFTTNKASNSGKNQVK
jgi:hypothetical protein